jgi:hypothetical protein
MAVSAHHGDRRFDGAAFEDQTGRAQTSEDWCTLPLSHGGLCLWS